MTGPQTSIAARHCGDRARRTRTALTVAWVVLIVAGLLEIVWSLALKEASGLTRPVWSALGIGVAMLSLGMLSYALKSLPVGTAYAVWVGIGTVASPQPE
ncbi:DMT family transporter [Allosalinactinospora lopnorensis]|uniref:DMT family transporter n=1 Tax=Allosalinactinospora lopnorensis TaxID=1352348 RepID=UPI000A8000CB